MDRIDGIIAEYGMWEIGEELGVLPPEGRFQPKHALANQIVDLFTAEPPDTRHPQRWTRRGVYAIDASESVGRLSEVDDYLQRWSAFLKQVVRYYASRIMVTELYTLMDLIRGREEDYTRNIQELDEFFGAFFKGQTTWLKRHKGLWAWYRMVILGGIYQALKTPDQEVLLGISTRIKELPMCCYDVEMFGAGVIRVLRGRSWTKKSSILV